MATSSSESKANIKWLTDQGVPKDLIKGYGDNLNPNEASKILDTYQKSRTHVIPDGMLPPSMQNLTVYNLPQEAFKQLVPQLVPGTPEYQAAMDKLSTAYFDVIQQQLNASTQQEQEAANYNWQNLKKSIETNLNISLSNDAFQAWDQVQAMKNQYNQQGIAGSGLENEAIDAYLAKARRSGEVTRTENQTKEESAQQDYYMKFATPQQIRDFATANPDKAKAWGLIPSDEIRNALTPAALRAKYPNMSDEDIQTSIASVLDENGNYRSNLYQKYMTGSSLGANQGNVDTANIVRDQYGNEIAKPVKPSDTGVLDIEAAKKQYQSLNTPLASQAANYKALVDLGAIKPTSGADSGTSYGTQFNQITPNPNLPASGSNSSTITNPITVPGSMTSQGTDGSSSSKKSSSSSSSSSNGRRKGESAREFEARMKGATLNYKTGAMTLPGKLL